MWVINDCVKKRLNESETIHPFLSSDYYSSRKWGDGRGRLFEVGGGGYFKFRLIEGRLFEGGALIHFKDLECLSKRFLPFFVNFPISYTPMWKESLPLSLGLVNSPVKPADSICHLQVKFIQLGKWFQEIQITDCSSVRQEFSKG